MDSEYRLRIVDSYTPATLPMKRLAEYVATFAKLLGDESNVHFGGVENGSAVLVATVDQPVRSKVADRVRGVRNGTAPKDVLRIFNDLDNMLREDNATGSIVGNVNAVIVPFLGRTRTEPLIFGPFRQEGTLDGQVYRIGGKDETKHVHIRDGSLEFTELVTTEAVALRLRHHLFGGTLRFHGQGTWFRSEDGTWQLRNFRIADFEELDGQPLGEVIANLRKVKGNHWNEVPDPVSVLLAERSGEGDGH
jgi:hypothetical protein